MKKNFLTAGLIILLTSAVFGFGEPDQDFNAPHTVIDVSKKQAVDQTVKPATKIDAYIYAGDKYFKAGNFNAALKYYFYVTKIAPTNVKAWKKTAFCYYQLKKHNYAYYCFQKVLKYDPADKDAVDFMDYYKTIMSNSASVREKREMFDPLWRSAICPGFGQFYNKQYLKGVLYGAAFFGALGLTFYEAYDEKAKYSKYVTSNENQEIAFDEAQSSWNNALIWGIITGVAYGVNVYDACANYNSDEARGLSVEIRGRSVYLAASMEW